MAIYKNTAGQKVAVFAYTAATGAAKTGDAANITAYLSKDWAAAALTDTNPTEMDAANMAGWYVFDLTQAETNAEVLVLAPKSATTGVVIDQVQLFTDSLSTTRAGYLDNLNGHAAQSGDAYARIGAGGAGLAAVPWGTTWSAEVQGATTGALATYDGPTKSELDTGLAALNNLSSAQAQAAVAAALAIYGAATEDDVTGLAIPTTGQVADAVWDELLAGHATAGSAGVGLAAAGAAGDPWATVLPGAYASNQAGALFAWMKEQLATTIITVAELAATAGSVTIHRGDTWTATMTGLGDLSGRTKLWFTVKAREWEADSEALVQIEETDGLLRLANRAPVGTGSLTVTDAVTGSITLTLSAPATAMLAPGVGNIYDVQMLAGTTVRTLGVGAVTITADATRAVS